MTLDELAKRGLTTYKPQDVGTAYQAVYGNKWSPTGRLRGAAGKVPVLANQTLDIPGGTIPVSQLMYLYRAGQQQQPTAGMQNMPTGGAQYLPAGGAQNISAMPQQSYLNEAIRQAQVRDSLRSQL
jgi:hypothetical protein